MSENYLKHYEMELIILSPVYIGSGEKIGKKEYIFLPLKKRVLVPDLGKMYTALMKKRAIYVGGYANTIGNLVERS